MSSLPNIEHRRVCWLLRCVAGCNNLLQCVAVLTDECPWIEVIAVVHAHTHIHAYTYTRTQMHTHARAHTHMHIHSFEIVTWELLTGECPYGKLYLSRSHAHIHYTYTLTQVVIYACLNTYKHTCIYIHIYTCILIYIYSFAMVM